jgi:hypothetical protein
MRGSSDWVSRREGESCRSFPARLGDMVAVVEVVVLSGSMLEVFGVDE